jgi:uncharacterized protein
MAEIRSLFLQGNAGRLEALLNAGAPDAKFSALVCHPHPLHGGTLHNKVVYHAMKALNGLGLPVLRFNFRGTGLSEGVHDNGQGEIEDVGTAVEFLHREFGRPILFAGFSFGAATGLRACCPDPCVSGLIALGTPVAVQGRIYSYEFLQACTKPKLFISGTRDEFAPVNNLEQIFSQVAEPKEMVLVEDADHFFVGRLNLVQTAIENWVRTHFFA